MSMYYGDSSGKAKKIILAGVPGPEGPQGIQGPQGPQGPVDENSIKKNGSTETTARIPFKNGISTNAVTPFSPESGVTIGTGHVAPGSVPYTQPTIITAATKKYQVPVLTVGKEHSEDPDQVTVTAKSTADEVPYIPLVDDSIVTKRYVDDLVKNSGGALEKVFEITKQSIVLYGYKSGRNIFIYLMSQMNLSVTESIAVGSFYKQYRHFSIGKIPEEYAPKNSAQAWGAHGFINVCSFSAEKSLFMGFGDCYINGTNLEIKCIGLSADAPMAAFYFTPQFVMSYSLDYEYKM